MSNAPLAAINAVVELTPSASVGLTNVVVSPTASGPLLIISTISSTLFAISVILPGDKPTTTCSTTVCLGDAKVTAPATLCAVVFK